MGSPETKVNSELKEVQDIMMQNIERVIERDGNLTTLDEKSADLEAGAKVFNRKSNNLRRQMWWKDKKMLLIIASVVFIGILLLVVIMTNH